MASPRVLIVRLPCKKVFPAGPIYLLSLIRKTLARTEVELLDLAVVDRKHSVDALTAEIRRFSPDVVAFSWRDIQVFFPQDSDAATRDTFGLFYGDSLVQRVTCAMRSLGDMLAYHGNIDHTFRLIHAACSAARGARIALGGPGVKIFHEWLRPRIPERVRVFADTGLAGFFRFLGSAPPADQIEPAIDLAAVESSFPQWQLYKNETIGVQTKRGCPLSCLSCLYGFLEGRRVSRREPSRVVAEIESYLRRWGSTRFWFADAQLLAEPEDEEHLSEILGGITRRGMKVRWSGYVRIHQLSPAMAKRMVSSGLTDLEVSLVSGAQDVIDALCLDYPTDRVIRGFEVLKDAGYRGRILLNLSLNAPGETEQTLRDTLEMVRRAKRIFGEESVVPVAFFLAIQPHTGLEARAIEQGLIRKGYNPLSASPRNMLRLIYNPAPLGAMLGRCCAKAFATDGQDAGARILSLIEHEVAQTGG